MKQTAILAAFAASLLSAPAAVAGDSLSIDGFVGVTSDMRDRGISISDKDATLRGSIYGFHDSGIYAGVDAALIDDGMGGDEKTEFFAGYSFDTDGGYTVDLSVELDGIHGITSEYYPEYKAALSRDFGLAFLRGGLSFSPEGRWNTPGVDSWYAYSDIEIPLPVVSEITLITHMGYDLRDNRSNLFDWSAGFSIFMDEFEVTVMYEDSSLDDTRAKGRFVLGTRFYF